jgi:hypothetical protein
MALGGQGFIAPVNKTATATHQGLARFSFETSDLKAITPTRARDCQYALGIVC